MVQDEEMRVVVMGSGSPMATAALNALAAGHRVETAVIPPPRGGLRSRVMYAVMTRRFRRACRRHRIPLLSYDPGQTQRELKEIAADLICVATFPFILKRDLTDTARLGAINIHPSLLPKHRGIDPLFWSYANDERESGVTVHWIDDGVDSGDVLGQVAIPVPHGAPSSDVYREMSRVAADLVASVVAQIEGGSARAVAQDGSRATLDPDPAKATIDRSPWTVSHAWHFLAGLSDRSNNLLGGPKHGGPVGQVATKHDERPGTVLPVKNGLRVYCVDGYVDVAPDSWRGKLGRFLNRVRA